MAARLVGELPEGAKADKIPIMALNTASKVMRGPSS
jgi:hypothetical protein